MLPSRLHPWFECRFLSFLLLPYSSVQFSLILPCPVFPKPCVRSLTSHLLPWWSGLYLVARTVRRCRTKHCIKKLIGYFTSKFSAHPSSIFSRQTECHRYPYYNQNDRSTRIMTPARVHHVSSFKSLTIFLQSPQNKIPIIWCVDSPLRAANQFVYLEKKRPAKCANGYIRIILRLTHVLLNIPRKPLFDCKF